jgi:OTU domain-containing protein 6
MIIRLALQNDYQVTRNAAADYILSHADDFLPFLPSASGEDGDGAEDDGMMTPEGMAEYCRRIRESGEWGGEPEVSPRSCLVETNLC